MKILKAISIASIIFIFSLISVGCSNSSNSSDKSKDKSNTRIVSTVKGEVEVPVNPKKIIPLPYSHGNLLVLGVVPIAVGETYKGAAFYDKVKNLPTISKWDEEEIMSFKPDLIFTSNEKSYEKFKKIAPTVFVPSDMGEAGSTKFMSEVLGVEEKFTEANKKLNDKIADGKAKLKEAGLYDKRFSIYEAWEEGSMMVVGNKWGRGGNLIYDFLGLKPNELVEKEIIDGKGDAYRIISTEVIDKYAGDYILYSEGMENKIDFSKNKVWNSIPAVREGRVVTIDPELFYYQDIYSLTKQVDYLVDNLVKNSK
ncbi:ABC transporter substrate-binding protein [Clostridium botulinum]|uniref:ABC transporter substrate-binding protein n=1 Tax=Clostridium botulinum TaxID=1491 RepID=UPI003DA494A8